MCATTLEQIDCVLTVDGEGDSDGRWCACTFVCVCVGDTLPVHLIILSLKRSNSPFQIEVILCHWSKRARDNVSIKEKQIDTFIKRDSQ